MSLAVVTLKKGEGRLLKSGGMWIFDNEVASILTDILWEEDLSIRIPGLWYVFFQEMRIL